MRIPLWLSDYIELTETPRQIADRLTFSGTEVESIETIGSDFTGFLVAEVRAVERHPNADKLSVCRALTARRSCRWCAARPMWRRAGSIRLRRLA